MHIGSLRNDIIIKTLRQHSC